MNKDFFSKERFKYIIILALFNYIFLGTEYLFDNIVGDIKPQSVVGVFIFCHYKKIYK